MRPVALALAAVALSTAAAAQPTSPPDVYAEAGLNGGFGGGGLGWITAPSVAVGVRLPSGVEVGAYATRVGFGRRASVLAFGPEARVSREVGPGTTLDVRAGAGVGLYGGDAGYRGATGLATALEASATRRVGLGRGVDLALTGGAYGVATRLSGLEAPGPLASRSGTEAGVLAGVRLEFDAFGGRVGIGPSGGVPVVGSGELGALGALPYLGTLRNRGLVTLSF